MDAIGDYMLFRQILRDLRKSPLFQDKKILLYGNAAWQPLAEALDHETFDEFIPILLDRFKEDLTYRREVLQQVSSLAPAIALHPTFSRDYVGDVLTLASNATRRIGFKGSAENMPRAAKWFFDRLYTEVIRGSKECPFELDRYLDILALAGGSPSHFCYCHTMKPVSVKRDGIFEYAGSPVFFVGASRSDKRWPYANYLRLAEISTGLFDKPVLLCGGNDVICNATEECTEQRIIVDLIGKTSLLELAALIQTAPLLVSNDSMAVHLAATFGTPTVAIANGQHLGRFLPYPDFIAPRLLTVYPPKIRFDDHKNAADMYVSNVGFDIKEINLEVVLDAVYTVLKRKNFSITSSVVNFSIFPNES
jgi:ADP-heptose:LPS heptosyltransferase